ncbi:hypothetical protein Gogos_018115, partial [Gossypium gossypioides]|nr:hypothetical protein [Gossypium gossypioides]
GCKLDPTLINALVERWRPETHPFHLTCDDCTITLENITLQLSLAVNGPFVTGAVVVPGKEDLRETLLGKWLLRLVDFKECGQLSWGLAVLATLYQELYRATELNKLSIGGCLLLLQSWAWWRLPFLRPQVDTPYTFPLVEPWAEVCRTTEETQRYPIAVRSTLEIRVQVEAKYFAATVRHRSTAQT